MHSVADQDLVTVLPIAEQMILQARVLLFQLYLGLHRQEELLGGALVVFAILSQFKTQANNSAFQMNLGRHLQELAGCVPVTFTLLRVVHGRIQFRELTFQVAGLLQAHEVTEGWGREASSSSILEQLNSQRIFLLFQKKFVMHVHVKE